MSGAAHQFLLAAHHWLHARPPLFPVLKTALFAALAITSTLYIRDDVLAAAQTLDGEATLMDRLSWFAISIDYVAWYTLLLLYELQTSLVDDERLRGGLKWLFNGIAGLCYIAVFWALAGYLGKLWLIVDIVPLTGGDPCRPESLVGAAALPALANPGSLLDGTGAAAGNGLVWMQALDHFVAVTADNCAALGQALAAGDLSMLGREPILFLAQDYWGLGGAWSLVWADAIEAVLWIVALGLIQLEIVLQLRGELPEALLAKLQTVKFFVYAAIIAVTAYYTVFGRTLDLYDSILWLLAFLFIEINITDWNEDARRRPPTTVSV